MLSLPLFSGRRKRRRSKRVVANGGVGGVPINVRRRSPTFPLEIINIEERPPVALPKSPTRFDEKLKMKEVEELPMVLPTLSPVKIQPQPPETTPTQLRRVPSLSPAIQLDFTHESLLASFPSELLGSRQGSSASSLASREAIDGGDIVGSGGGGDSKKYGQHVAAPSPGRRQAPAPITIPKSIPSRPLVVQAPRSVAKTTAPASSARKSRTPSRPSISKPARHPFAFDNGDSDGAYSTESEPDSAVSGLTLARDALSSAFAMSSGANSFYRDDRITKASSGLKSSTGFDFGAGLGSVGTSGGGGGGFGGARDGMGARSGSRHTSRHRMMRQDSATLPPEDFWRKELTKQKSNSGLSTSSRGGRQTGRGMRVAGIPFSAASMPTPTVHVSDSRLAQTSNLETRSPDSANPPTPPAKDHPPLSAPLPHTVSSVTRVPPGRAGGHITESSVSTSASMYSTPSGGPSTPMSANFGSRLLSRRPSGPRPHTPQGQSSGSKFSPGHMKNASLSSTSSHGQVVVQTATMARLTPLVAPPPTSPLPSTPEEDPYVPAHVASGGTTALNYRSRRGTLDVPESMNGNPRWLQHRRISRISETSTPPATLTGSPKTERQRSQGSSNVDVSNEPSTSSTPSRQESKISVEKEDARKSPPIQTDVQTTAAVDVTSPLSAAVSSPSVYSSSSVQSPQADGEQSLQHATAPSSPSVYSSHVSHLVSPRPSYAAIASLSPRSQTLLTLSAEPSRPANPSPRNVTSVPVSVTMSVLATSPWANQFEKEAAAKQGQEVEHESGTILDNFQFIHPATNTNSESTAVDAPQSTETQSNSNSVSSHQNTDSPAQGSVQTPDPARVELPASPPPTSKSSIFSSDGSAPASSASNTATISNGSHRDITSASRSTDSINESAKPLTSLRSRAASSSTASSSAIGARRNRPIPLKGLHAGPGISGMRSPTGSVRSGISINLLPIGERRPPQAASPDSIANSERRRPVLPQLLLSSQSPTQAATRTGPTSPRPRSPDLLDMLIPEGHVVTPISTTYTGMSRKRSGSTPEALSLASSPHGSKKYELVQETGENAEEQRANVGLPANDEALVQTFPETPEAFSPAFSSELHSLESGPSSRLSSIRLSRRKHSIKRRSISSTLASALARPALPSLMTDNTSPKRDSRNVARSPSAGSTGHLSSVSSGTSIISPLQPPPTPPPSIPTSPYSEIQIPTLLPLTAPLLLQNRRVRPPLPIGPRKPSQPWGGTSAPKTVPDITESRSQSLGDTIATPITCESPEQVEQMLPSPIFQRTPVKWKAYGLEAAQLKFTQKQLQEVASRSIRQSGEPTSIRLLPLEVLDGELSDALNQLESRRTDICNSYKAQVRKREMLFHSFTTLMKSPTSSDNSTALQLASQLSEVTYSCDRLTEELFNVSDQIEQIQKLMSTHNFSALALVVRKLNSSLKKQMEEVQQLRAEIVDLYADREEGWNQAQSIAQQLDELNERFATTSTDGPSRTQSQSRRASRVSMARKGSLRMNRAGLRLSTTRGSIRSSSSSMRVNVSNSARSTFSTDDLIPPVPPLPYRNFLAGAGEREGIHGVDVYTAGATTAEYDEMQKAQQELLDMLGISLNDLRASAPSRPQSELVAVSRPGSPIPIHVRRVSSHRSSLRQSQSVKVKRRARDIGAMGDGNWI